MEWNGGMLLTVPPEYTSRECPSCSCISEENRKTQALFKCIDCEYENHADVVGAINLLERGYRLLTCGELAFKPLCEAGTHRSELAKVS